MSSTHYEVSPDRKEANTLMGWYEIHGKGLTYVPVGSDFSDNGISIYEFVYCYIFLLFDDYFMIISLIFYYFMVISSITIMCSKRHTYPKQNAETNHHRQPGRKRKARLYQLIGCDHEHQVRKCIIQGKRHLYSLIIKGVPNPKLQQETLAKY